MPEPTRPIPPIRLTPANPAVFFVDPAIPPVTTQAPRDPSEPFRMSKVVLPPMDRAERKAYERKVWIATLMFTPASRRDSLIAFATLMTFVIGGLAVLIVRG